MALRINQNISALNAQRNLATVDARLAISIERLSSGLRINSAADDPAGLIISEMLRAQASGLSVALSNAAKGNNMVKTAEGALGEVTSLLRQMRDLALDAASEGTNDDATRAALQAQVTSSIATIDQIASTTKYGSKNLLDGSAGTSATIIDSTNILTASAVTSTPEGYIDLDITAAATKAIVDGSNTYTAATDNIDNDGSITINGVSIGTFTTADTVQDVIDAIVATSAQTGVTAAWDVDHVELKQLSYGSDKGVTYVETADVLNGASTAVQWGVDAAATVTYGDATTEAFTAGNGLQLKGATSSMTIMLTEAGNDTGVDPQDGIYVTQGKMEFQVGNAVGEKVSVSVGAVSASQLGTTGTVAAIDISTTAGADAAITILDEAIEEVNTLRSNLGAFVNNQLQATVNSLTVARENLLASESAIRDTDFASQVVEFTRDQILVQAGTAMLAQANSLPQNVLALLR